MAFFAKIARFRSWPASPLRWGVCLSHETAISRIEIVACRRFGLDSALREHDQGWLIAEPGALFHHHRALMRGHALHEEHQRDDRQEDDTQ